MAGNVRGEEGDVVVSVRAVPDREALDARVSAVATHASTVEPSVEQVRFAFVADTLRTCEPQISACMRQRAVRLGVV
jgi:hypothetical protein